MLIIAWVQRSLQRLRTGLRISGKRNGQGIEYYARRARAHA